MNVVELSQATANSQLLNCDPKLSLQCAALNVDGTEIANSILLIAAAMIAVAAVIYGVKRIFELFVVSEDRERENRRARDEDDEN